MRFNVIPDDARVVIFLILLCAVCYILLYDADKNRAKPGCNGIPVNTGRNASKPDAKALHVDQRYVIAI